MAAKPRPSFLKRQKEQKRNEKAAAKRELRERKKQARIDGGADPEVDMPGDEFADIADIVPEANERG
jgi:hypothetical protein